MTIHRRRVKTAGLTIPREVIEMLKLLKANTRQLLDEYYQESGKTPMKSASRRGRRYYKRADDGGFLSSVQGLLPDFQGLYSTATTFVGENKREILGALGGLGVGVVLLQLLPTNKRHRAVKTLLGGAGGAVAGALIARNLTADRLDSFWKTVTARFRGKTDEEVPAVTEGTPTETPVEIIADMPAGPETLPPDDQYKTIRERLAPIGGGSAPDETLEEGPVPPPPGLDDQDITVRERLAPLGGHPKFGDKAFNAIVDQIKYHTEAAKRLGQKLDAAARKAVKDLKDRVMSKAPDEESVDDMYAPSPWDEEE